MKLAALITFFLLIIGLATSSYVTKLEIQTDDEALQENDAVVFRIYDYQGKSCLTTRFDTNDGFDLFTLDTITGTDLGNCGDVDILSGNVKEVVISHEGQHAWSFDFIKVYTDNGLHCQTWSGSVSGGILNL